MWDTTLLILLILAVIVLGLVVLDRLEFLSIRPRRRGRPPGGEDPPGGVTRS